MEPTYSTWPRKQIITEAHVKANSQGKTFVVAFNKRKSGAILLSPLDKFQVDHPFGLTEEDIFYRAEPGMPVPAEVASKRQHLKERRKLGKLARPIVSHVCGRDCS